MYDNPYRSPNPAPVGGTKRIGLLSMIVRRVAAVCVGLAALPIMFCCYFAVYELVGPFIRSYLQSWPSLQGQNGLLNAGEALPAIVAGFGSLSIVRRLAAFLWTVPSPDQA